MAISHVQDAGTTFTASTSSAPAFSGNTTIGNVVIVAITADNLSATASLSGFGVGTWYLLRAQRNTGSGTAIENFIFGGVVTSAATTCTITFSGAVSGGVSMMEFSGATLNIDATGGRRAASASTVPTNMFTPRSANTL